MLNNKTFLAVIPARGGSKRLPKKNLLTLGGKPLIVWTIEAALQSSYIDSVIVSSDDDDILALAKTYAVQVIKRPSYLATDTATSFDVVKHAVENMKKHDYVVLLQPTSPFRTSLHVHESINMLNEKCADAVISVAELEHSLAWVNALPEDNSMAGFLKKDFLNKRSQDLETHYKLNGAIYICQADRLLQEQSFFLKDNVYAYKMDNRSSVDIDTELDFQFADFICQKELGL